MEGTVIEIIEQYLEWELVKHQRGYSLALRLQYDNDAKYYLEKGYSEEEALHADTVISFWTIYKTLLEKQTGWTAYRTTKSISSLLRQIRSKRDNDYTAKILHLNEKIDDFAKTIYTEGNYMLLPIGKRTMNNVRYNKFEDRVDLTLYHCFSGGELSMYFETDEHLREWIMREKLSILFADSDIKKDNLFWLVDNKKKITDMTVEEIYTYIDSAKSLIEKRAEYNQNQ